MKKLFNDVVGIIYVPIYLVGFILLKISRLSLAFSYLLLLQKRQAVDIVKNIFTTKF